MATINKNPHIEISEQKFDFQFSGDSKVYVDNTGSISATTYYGDGSNLTGISSSSIPNSPTFSDLTVTGTTSLQVLSATTITANTYYGDGSNLTNLPSPYLVWNL